jgi:hypothetical protein
MPVSSRRWVNRIEVYWGSPCCCGGSPHRHGYRGPDGVVEHGDDQLGGRSWAAVPANDLVGEGISNTGEPQHPFQGEDARISAIHVWFGLVAVKSRASGSGAGVCLGFCGLTRASSLCAGRRSCGR